MENKRKKFTHFNHCMVCENQNEIEIDEEDFRKWKFDGMHIQDAFPYLNKDERELILTGTHPHCWDSLFDEEE